MSKLLQVIKEIEKISTRRNKRISTVVKINFHGSKNQFSSPMTPANFGAGYACVGNTLICLAGIRGKNLQCSHLIG